MSDSTLLPTKIETALGAVECAIVAAGPAVLAVHGAMGGFDQSLRLVRAVVADDRRAIAVSRPGYLGTALEIARTPERQADLHAATLDALGIDRAALVAVSGGGHSALAFALRHRARCAALVLVSSIGAPLRVSPAFRLKLWLAGYPSIAAWLATRLAREPERAAARAIRDPEVRARTLAEPTAGLLLREALAAHGDRTAERIAGTRNDIANARVFAVALDEIRVPTLVVHGRADRAVPFDRHGAELARRIPGAALLALEEAEHFALFTHRDVVRARVAAFLRMHA